MPTLDCVPDEVLLEFTQPDPPKAEPIETAFQIIERGFREHLVAFECLQAGINAIPDSTPGTPHGVTCRLNNVGSPVNLRTRLSFVEGSGIIITVTDDPAQGEYDILISLDVAVIEAAITHGNIGGLGADDHLQYIIDNPQASVRNTIKPDSDVVNLVLDKVGAPIVAGEDYLRFIDDTGAVLTRVSVEGWLGFTVADPLAPVHIQNGAGSGAAISADAFVFVDSVGDAYLQAVGGATSTVGLLLGSFVDPNECRLVYDNTPANKTLHFYTDGLPQVAIRENAVGRPWLGVGVSTPQQRFAFHVIQNSAGGFYPGWVDADGFLFESSDFAHIHLLTASTGQCAVFFSDPDARARAGIIYNHDTDILSLRSAGSEAFTIDASGNSATTNNLTVGGDLAVTGDAIGDWDFGGDVTVADWIGVNGPARHHTEQLYLRHVAAAALYPGNILDCMIMEGSTHVILQMVCDTTGQAQICFSDIVRNAGRIAYVHSTNFMKFDTNLVERFRLDSTGGRITGALDVTGALSVGSASGDWDFTNDVTVGRWVGVNRPARFHTEQLYLRHAATTLYPGNSLDCLVMEGTTHVILQMACNASGQAQIGFSDTARGSGRIVYHHNGDTFRFDTNLVERMRLGATGLGVGTTNPDRRLHAEIDSALTSTVQQVFRLTHTTSGTPANDIGLGMEFEQETAAGNREIIAGIQAIAYDVTAASEDGRLLFLTMGAGAAMAEQLRIDSVGSRFAGNIGFNGLGPLAIPAAWTITNPVATRVFDTTTVTTQTLAEVVGTLIQDLINYGLEQ